MKSGDNKKENSNKDNEELRNILKKKIEAAVWLQAIGQVSEAILLSKLYSISENPESKGEKTLLSGAWIQATGQLMEAVGVSREVSSENIEIIKEGQTIAISGEYLQGIGGLIAAVGGTEVFQEEFLGMIDYIP